ncbi:hypothetical protein PR202_gb22452 [Eleusine coracana subsp. coracana]|uniref:Plastocyanin-like domain-containing protein n=1 Tax=Eleusine coracana subsp. coracana TaxID=191504 RepID=A0AAV5FHR7_ELECO|nr:hypothetical protein PR202_gb22452 [Eleusine coracana subsp. coracana]
MRTGEDVKPADQTPTPSTATPGTSSFPILAPPPILSRCAWSRPGKTYLLCLINVGLTNDMFFGVAGHRLAVVATDSRYTKPFTVDHVMVASGQTLDLLLHANANHDNNGGSTEDHHQVMKGRGRAVNLPAVDDMDAASAFQARLRSLASRAHPVDERILVHNHSIIRGGGFLDEPADQQPAPFTVRATKVKVLDHGRVLKVVFQDTAVLGTESHPNNGLFCRLQQGRAPGECARCFRAENVVAAT